MDYQGKHVKSENRVTNEMSTTLLKLLFIGVSSLTVCLWNILISIDSTIYFEKYIVASCVTAMMTVLFINLFLTVIERLAAQYPNEKTELLYYNGSFEVTVKYLGFGASQCLFNLLFFFTLRDYLSPIPLLCGAGAAFTAVSWPWALKRATKQPSVNQRVMYRLFITEAIVFIILAVPVN